MKGFLKWAGIALVAFIAFVVVGNMLYKPETPEQQMAKIKESCEREFGAGTPAASECQLAIVVKQVEKDQQDRMSRAESGAR